MAALSPAACNAGKCYLPDTARVGLEELARGCCHIGTNSQGLHQEAILPLMKHQDQETLNN